MDKYKVEVGAFSTRFIQRRLTVWAKNEEEAREKAINMFWRKELKAGSIEPGEPQVDEIVKI